MNNDQIELDSSTALNKPEQRAKDTPGVIVFPPVLFVGAVVSGVALQYLWPIHPWWVLPARIAGSCLIVFALFTATGALRCMKRAGTNVRPDKPTTAIVSVGPYRFTRNPIYLANTALYVGVTLVCNAFWPLLTLAPFFVLLHWGVVRREERYLEAKFGEVYLAYKSRVRRWI